MTQDTMYKSIVLFVALMLWTSLPVTAYTAEGDISKDEFVAKFLKSFPKPAWWDEVSIEGVVITTVSDISNYWQNKERTAQQFFKACYQAILDHPSDPHIIMLAVDLMDYQNEDYPYMMDLQEYALEHYFSYVTPAREHRAETVAGITLDLLKNYNDHYQYDKASSLYEKLVKDRELEINDHQLEFLALEYARALHSQGRSQEAMDALSNAITKYNGDWERLLEQNLKRYKQFLFNPRYVSVTLHSGVKVEGKFLVQTPELIKIETIDHGIGFTFYTDEVKNIQDIPKPQRQDPGTFGDLVAKNDKTAVSGEVEERMKTAGEEVGNPAAAGEQDIYLARFLKETTKREEKLQMADLFMKHNRKPEYVDAYTKFLVAAVLDGGLEEIFNPKREIRTPTAIGQYAFIASNFGGFSTTDFDKIKDARVIPVLIEALNAPDTYDPSKKNQKIQKPVMGKPWISAGRNIDRQQIPVALANLGAVESIDPLKKILRSHQDYYLKVNTAYALGLLLDREDSRLLENELRDAEDFNQIYYLFPLGNGLIEKGDEHGVALMDLQYSTYYNSTEIHSVLFMIEERLNILENFKSQQLEQFYKQILGYAPLTGILMFDGQRIDIGLYSNYANEDDALIKLEKRIVNMYTGILKGIQQNKLIGLAPLVRRIAEEAKNNKIRDLSNQLLFNLMKPE